MKLLHLFSFAACAASLCSSLYAQSPIITATDNWDYLHPTDGTDPATSDPDFATTWYTLDGSYNGPAFTEAQPGPFSYGGITYFTTNALTGTLIGVNNTATAPATGLRYSAYFKKQFTTTEDYTDATLELLVDDGAVVYIDGVEVTRVNMSGLASNASGDSYTMLADDANDESVLGPTVSIGALTAGTHVIAISLHNALNSSSDLGILVRLFGSSPPPPPLLISEVGGAPVDVPAVAGFTGWSSGSTYGFSMNGPAGTLHTLQSEPIDVTAAGEEYFTMQLYAFETSAGSNFEAADSFAAKLLVTLDDDSQTEVNLIPAELDTDANGTLTGDEFDPGLMAVSASVAVGRQLSGTVPANAKFVALQIQAINDSTSEEFRIGGARLSTVPSGSDDDGDGLTREVELFSGTNPGDGADVFRLATPRYEYNDTDMAYRFYTVFPAVAGKRYTVEETSDGGATWEYYGSVTATTSTPAVNVYLTLGSVPSERQIFRVRCSP